MRVVRIRDIEDCFDGSFIKEFELDQKISRSFIHKLAQGYCLEYFSDFARPFFRIESENEFQIKGVENNTTMQIIFYRNCTSQCMAKLIRLIHNIE